MGKKSKRREQARQRLSQGGAPSASASRSMAADDSSSISSGSLHGSSRSPFSHPPSNSPEKSALKRVYEDHYKLLLFIPVILLLLALAQIGYQMATTGDFIYKGVSLKGGITMTVTSLPAGADAVDVENALSSQFPEQDIGVRVLTTGGGVSGMIIETDLPSASQMNEFRDQFVEAVESLLDLKRSSYSVEVVGSSLGENFFSQTIKSLYIAFLFMGMVVFLYFGQGGKQKTASVVLSILAALFLFTGKSIIFALLSYAIGIGLLVMYFLNSIPSIAVILAAFSDVVMTIAVVNLLGVRISTAGIAAFLMLIGYSVDTDILLSTRVLKRKEGSVMDGVYSAIKPGVLMSLTTIIAVAIGLVFSKSEVLSQIMLIVLIGLFADILNTWIQNVSILRWFLEVQEKKKMRDPKLSS
ncbi:hypothetical protein HYU19_02680 [Candidatus Woesearchaeota archaeon]|nr:hypothetical protein [Candidatus Woesearchaeota archaeon]